jgi:hypothetical protein
MRWPRRAGLWMIAGGAGGRGGGAARRGGFLNRMPSARRDSSRVTSLRGRRDGRTVSPRNALTRSGAKSRWMTCLGVIPGADDALLKRTWRPAYADPPSAC